MQAKDYLTDVLKVQPGESMDFYFVTKAMINYADHCLAQYVASRPAMSDADKQAMDIIRKAADEITLNNSFPKQEIKR